MMFGIVSLRSMPHESAPENNPGRKRNGESAIIHI
jgi:hypothetical protein